MVLNISGGIDEEDTTEVGVFDDIEKENLFDSNMSDIPHGPVMENPRITNLFSTQRSWRVLRLPGGRAGNEGATGLRGFSNFMLQIIPGWRGQTIRDSPFRQMVTARMWQKYINEMEPIDDALELQAPYSPEEMLSLRMFCEEWNDDPGHIRFSRRLSQHPSTNTSDAVLKGNMVYDICTGQIELRTSRGGRGDGNIPIRLAHDILTSIPFEQYNFYTLNSIHAREGSAIYEQFLNRSVRLSSTEVAMVEEIENGLRGGGRGYATMSTSISGDPIEAFALMQQTVEALEIADHMTVRANLNALISPPYNYKSMAQQIDVGGTHGGRFVATDQVRYHQFNEGKLNDKKTTKDNTPLRMIIAQGRDENGKTVMWPKEQPKADKKSHPPAGFYMEMNQSGTGVERVWQVLTLPNSDNFIRIAGYDEQARAVSELVGGFNRVDARAIDERAGRGDPNRDAADRRRGVRGNPVRENSPGKKKESGAVRLNRFGAQTTMGRGNFIYVQILPKTQMSFTGKYKGRPKQTQYWEHGATSVADSTGLAKVFPGGPNTKNPGYFIKKGLHKRTDTAVPWMIALPRKSFQPFTDSEGRRTIRPKHRKALADPAWAKFTRLYGVPTYAGEPGKQNLFKIKKADRGKFYDNLRARPTKR